MIRSAHLVIADKWLVPLDAGWLARTEVNFGHQRLAADIPESRARALRLVGGEPLVLYDSLANVLWHGAVSNPPRLQSGVARLAGSGIGEGANKEAGRLLYQAEGTREWADAASDPFVDSNESGLMELDIKRNALVWVVPGTGETLASGDRVGAAFWAPGTPGGLSRIAGTKVAVLGGANMNFRISKFAGPQGAKTLVADVGTGSGAISQGLGSTHDAVAILLRANTGFANNASDRLRIRRLRVNGIADNTGRAASWDTFYADEVAADVFSRIGWAAVTTGIEQVNTNVLPLDHVSGSWADLLDYVAEIVDFYWLAPLSPEISESGVGQVPIFRSWGTDKWVVRKASGAHLELDPLRRYDSAVVPYQDSDGVWREATATAADPPGTGFVYVADPLEDVQASSSLADTVAQTLADRYAAERFTGRITVVEAQKTEGSLSTSAETAVPGDYAQLIRPGDTVRVDDWDSGRNVDLRVHAVELREDAVVLGIERPISPADVVASATQRRTRRRRGGRQWT